MKHRDINDRKKIRNEFVYMHRDELRQLFNAKDKTKELEFCDTIIRQHIPYSDRTNSIDILNITRRTYISLARQGIILPLDRDWR